MKALPILLLTTFLSFNVSNGQDIMLESFGSGLQNVVDIKHSGDNRLFIVEQDGLIQILNTNGTTNPQPFLDIDTQVLSGGERGLLGLAFHPQYDTNGYFYVNYTNNSGNTVISRFSVSTSDPSSANPNSELVLLTIQQPFSNHNGGSLTFGPNGYLFIATGDGGDGGDPGDRAQSLNTLLGKMLRIDVNSISNGNNYSIPSDNPYLNDNDNATLPEIWGLGLRNPWKFSFDRQTDDLWIGDVGQGEFEEINMVAGTASNINYGWRCYEGNSPFDATGSCPPMASLTFPVAEYSHNNSGNFKCSITGGYRYRGTAQPNLSGIYFFADYCSGEIGSLTQNGSAWTISYDDSFSGNNWTTFGEDVNGEIYIAPAGNSVSLYKIIQDSLSVDDPDQPISFKLYPNPSIGQNVTLDLTESSSSIQDVFLYDIRGKLIWSVENLDLPAFEISTQAYSSGIYIIEVTDTLGNKNRKKLILS